MPSRLLRRRATTALGIYGSAVLGFAATIVAARELSKHDFARFALVFGVTSLLQLFVDLTIDEVVVKYGNRYAAREQWGRFRRLFQVGLAIKMLGGAVGTLASRSLRCSRPTSGRRAGCARRCSIAGADPAHPAARRDGGRSAARPQPL